MLYDVPLNIKHSRIFVLDFHVFASVETHIITYFFKYRDIIILCIFTLFAYLK